MKELLFMEPVFKEAIWGGSRLNEVYGYTIPSDHTGECWAISAHKSGDCKIASGTFAGHTLSSLWEDHKELFGSTSSQKVFPLLIKIIEDNRLYLLDEGRDIDPQIMGNRPDKQALIAEEIPHAAPADIVDIDNYSVSVQGRKGGHTVYQNNGSQFVVLREGETLSSVAGEFGLSEKKLAKYNDFDAGTQPRPGDMVYIRAKNKRSQNGKLIHIAKDGETLHGISQMYGIRLKNLCSINRRSRDSQVRAGQQIRLM